MLLFMWHSNNKKRMDKADGWDSRSVGSLREQYRRSGIGGGDSDVYGMDRGGGGRDAVRYGRGAGGRYSGEDRDRDRSTGGSYGLGGGREGRGDDRYVGRRDGNEGSERDSEDVRKFLAGAIRRGEQ